MTAVRMFPFRWVLPVAQLFLCGVILKPFWGELDREARASLREYGLTHETVEKIDRRPPGAAPFNIDPDSPKVRRIVRRMELREWIVAALDAPAGAPDLLYAIVSPAHSEWVPKGMFFWSWRDISWPILGMFFWWLAGRGIDALLSARRQLTRPKIRWWEIIPALLVLAYGGILAVGVIIDRGTRESLPWGIFFVIGIVWFSLGVCTVWARVLQWRLRRAALNAA